MKPNKITITEQPDGTFMVTVRRYELTKIGVEPKMVFAIRLAADFWRALREDQN